MLLAQCLLGLLPLLLLLVGTPSAEESPPAPPPLGCPDGAEKVLLDLWNATEGATSWRDTEGWGTDEPCCEWHGVTCDANSSAVTTLRLANNYLRGTLPDSLGSLGPGLEQLIIYGNSPGRNGNCADGAGTGCLTGTIPATLNLLSGLKKIYLHYNVMSGTVPSLRFMTQLEFIHLGGNIPTWGENGGGMSGDLEWLGELQALEEVLLWTNSFSGTLPSTMRSMSRLHKLELGDNPLNAEFPDWIGSLVNLTELSAYESNFVGTLPATLGGDGSGKLKRLFLRDNRISGTLEPGMFARLTALEQLTLTSNQLSGSIPPTLSEAPQLRSLSVADNKIEGTLPSSISGMEHLHTLHLQYNEGMTSIAMDMEKPPELGTCSFQDCGWICPVPEWASARWPNGCSATCDPSAPELAALRAFKASGSGSGLASWDVGDDPCAGWAGVSCSAAVQRAVSEVRLYSIPGTSGLTGDIATLAPLVHLTALGLSYTGVFGTIPSGYGDMAALTLLQLHRTQVSGTIPAELGKLETLETLGLESTEVSGTIPDALGRLPALTGLWLEGTGVTGCGDFCSRHPSITDCRCP